jgi:hypothetical protein
MRAGRSAVFVIWSLTLAACVSELSQPRTTASATARTKRLQPQFECSFADGNDVVYRTYVMQSGALIERGPPRLRFKITSDDGETITAQHTARGSKTPTVVTIDLRRHEASLTQPRPDNPDVPTLRGTCAQSG